MLYKFSNKNLNKVSVCATAVSATYFWSNTMEKNKRLMSFKLNSKFNPRVYAKQLSNKV